MSAILCIWNRMGDYHRARIRALGAKAEKVITADLGQSDKLYQWESGEEKDHYVLSEKGIDHSDLLGRFSNFRRIVKKEGVSVVGLAGYGRSEYLLFMIYARLKGIHVILFSESWYSRGGLIDWLKGALIRMLANRYFASGERAMQHLESKLSIKKESISTGYSVVDNDHFRNEFPEYASNILLCMARFSPEKNLSMLLNAFSESKLSSNWKLCLVGGGPQKKELEQLAKQLGNIEIQNWVAYHSLPEWYGKASAFILPSTFEPWGLVVNEAMAASLPVWVSEQSGCVPDLVDESNGRVFDANDKNSIVESLNWLAGLTESELQMMGERSAEKIKDYSTATWADKFMAMTR